MGEQNIAEHIGTEKSTNDTRKDEADITGVPSTSTAQDKFHT